VLSVTSSTAFQLVIKSQHFPFSILNVPIWIKIQSYYIVSFVWCRRDTWTSH